jgi:hypothetical protein
LRTRIEPRMQQLRSLSEKQAHILLMLRVRLDELAHDDMHTEVWRRQREHQVRDQAQQALDDIETAAAEALGEIRDLATKATEREQGSVQQPGSQHP